MSRKNTVSEQPAVDGKSAVAGQYDITIVGAGIAGSALACALSAGSSTNKQRSNIRIALIEANSISADWPPCENGVNDFDPRVSALTVKSQQLLQDIGVWADIAVRRVSPFEQMRVWDADGTGKIHFDAADIHVPALGHIVENRLTVAALMHRVRRCPNVDVYDGQPVANIILAEDDSAVSTRPLDTKQVEEEGFLNRGADPIDSLVVVELADGTEIRSTLVVAADGANSPLRKKVGLPVREWDYHHDAIVCTVRVEQPHQKTAWQRFTQQGPLAFLPLATGESDLDRLHFCSIVWSQTRDQAEQMMALDDEVFCEALGRAFERRLGKIELVSRRFSFPLRQRHAIDYVKPGFALIADAAHAIHPLAGQGINLGLADVKALSECIFAAMDRGQEIGDIVLLNRYQRERKGDNLAMMAAVEGFKRLFAPVPPPLRWLRNAGMNAFDQQQGLKNQLIKYALGF